jgi:hypothetical protein
MLFSLLPCRTLPAAEKISWKSFKGKASALSKPEPIRSLPGTPRILEGKGELFPEIMDGFTFEVAGPELKISKKGRGKGDTTLKKDFEVITFTLPYSRERKGKYALAFFHEKGQWTVRSATVAKLRSPVGSLEIYDVDGNGRFDDPGVDKVQGLGAELLPLSFCLLEKKSRGLLHIWASGTQGAYWPVSEKAKDEWMQGMAAVNRIRGRGGLSPMGLDEDLCFALIKHAEYLIKNGLEKSEEESPGMPGYTPEGARAAKNILSFRGRKVTDFITQLGREFINPITAVSFIHPDLEKIGFCSHGPDGEAFYLCNVDLGLKRKEFREIVTYPSPGQTNVSCTGTGRRVSNALQGADFGQAIIIVFPEGELPKDVGVFFKNPRGLDTPYHLFTPDNPADPSEYPKNKNAVFIVPKTDLDPKTWYQVGISWEARRRMQKRIWRFKTGKSEKR